MWEFLQVVLPNVRGLLQKQNEGKQRLSPGTEKYFPRPTPGLC